MGRFVDFQREIYRAGLAGSLPTLPLNSAQLEQAAAEVMAPEVFGYVAGAAGEERTERANRAAFARWQILPRQLRGEAERRLEVELLGTSLAGPVLLAPVGALSAVRPAGDLEVARAALGVGVPMVVSTLSGSSLEEVATELELAAAPDPLARGWFQLYWPNDPELAQSLVRRVEVAGYGALVVTVDTWTLAWRPRDLGHGYLPFHHGVGLASYFSDPVFRARLERPPEEDPLAAAELWSALFGNPGLRWTDLAWLRQQTRLPILLKGICHPEDARSAAAAGVDGLIVSNHGGRQVDGARAALDCLVPVLDASAGLPVLFDSGIRSGADVLKALALGAKAVLLGRPYVYGLALAGADGVEHVLRALLAELDITLGLSGFPAVAGLSRDALAPAPAAEP